MTPEQYDEFRNIMSQFDDFVNSEKGQQAIKEIVAKFVRDFVSVKDISIGQKAVFSNLKPAEIPTRLHTYKFNSIPLNEIKKRFEK